MVEPEGSVEDVITRRYIVYRGDNTAKSLKNKATAPNFSGERMALAYALNIHNEVPNRQVLVVLQQPGREDRKVAVIAKGPADAAVVRTSKQFLRNLLDDRY